MLCPIVFSLVHRDILRCFNHSMIIYSTVTVANPTGDRLDPLTPSADFYSSVLIVLLERATEFRRHDKCLKRTALKPAPQPLPPALVQVLR